MTPADWLTAAGIFAVFITPWVAVVLILRAWRRRLIATLEKNHVLTLAAANAQAAEVTALKETNRVTGIAARCVEENERLHATVHALTKELERAKKGGSR